MRSLSRSSPKFDESEPESDRDRLFYPRYKDLHPQQLKNGNGYRPFPVLAESIEYVIDKAGEPDIALLR